MDIAASSTTFVILLVFAASVITAVIILMARKKINHEVIMSQGRWQEVAIKIKQNTQGQNG